MKNLLLITLLLSLGCSSTQRQNRQLRLSKLHLLKAQALGAKLDSVKTQVKENLTVSGIHDEESKDRDVNVNALDSLCSRLGHVNDSLRLLLNGKGTADTSFIFHPRGDIILGGSGVLGKIKKDFQKTVCPDVKKDTVYEQDIIVDGKHFKNKIHIIASSIGGHASLKVDAKPLVIPFVKEDVKVIAMPANIRKWWENWLIYLGILVFGVIVGFILGKVLKFGVNL